MGWILIGMAGILLVTLLAVELPVQDALPAQEMVMSNESIAGEIGGGILPSAIGLEPPLPLQVSQVKMTGRETKMTKVEMSEPPRS